MLQYRNIGYHWQLSKQQKEVLQQYYAANQLLVDCLKSGCEVTTTVQEQIEETLLSPIARTSSFASSSRCYCHHTVHGHGGDTT